jgi:hypothetical protein
MEFRPFTLEEAEEICEDFEDLKDTEFSYNGNLILVDDVIVAPSSQIVDLPASAPGENGFDVTIIASSADPGTQYRISIREYIDLKGVSYNFPS